MGNRTPGAASKVRKRLDVADIVRRHAAGESLHTIARHHGVTAPTIAARLHDAGVETSRPSWRGRPGRVPRMPAGDEARARVAEMARQYADGSNMEAIALRMGVSRTTVHNWLRAFGVDTSVQVNKALIALDVDAVVRAYLAHEPIARIARRHAVSTHTIVDRLRRARVYQPGRRRISGRDDAPAAGPPTPGSPSSPAAPTEPTAAERPGSSAAD